MRDARCLLELPETCHSQLRTALAPSTCQHNNKWPECKCAPATLYLTSCSSRECNNMTPLGNQACISRHCQWLWAVQYVLKLSLLSIYLVLMSRSSTNLVPLSNQGIVQQSGSIILLGMRFSLNLAVKVFREPNF